MLPEHLLIHGFLSNLSASIFGSLIPPSLAVGTMSAACNVSRYLCNDCLSGSNLKRFRPDSVCIPKWGMYVDPYMYTLQCVLDTLCVLLILLMPIAI